MFRIQDRTLPRKWICFLAVLASTLTVALARDGSIPTAGCAYLAGSEDQIDVSQHVVDAVRVMFDAARVHHHCCLRASIQSSGFDDLVCRYTADLRGDVR